MILIKILTIDSVNICDNRRGMIEYRQDDLIKL